MVIKEQFKEFLKIHAINIKEAAREHGCVYLTFLPYSADDEMTEVNIELGAGEVVTIPFPKEVVGEADSIPWRFYLKDYAEIFLEVEIIINGNDWDTLLSCEEPAKLYRFFKQRRFTSMNEALEKFCEKSA